jgi:hypothetical protein
MSSVAPGAHAPGHECVAASRLVHIIVPVFLGLTPQAMNMPPLRGFGGSRHEDGGDPGTRAAASHLGRVTSCRWWRPGNTCRRFAPRADHLIGMAAIRERVPPLRDSGRSPHADGGARETHAAASRVVHIFMPVFLGLTPQAMNMPPLRGFGGSHHGDGGDPGASHLRQVSSCSRW